jgi:hypothetical protein
VRQAHKPPMDKLPFYCINTKLTGKARRPANRA